MRWPFGPPHLTLKPSKQNKTRKKQNNKKQQKNTKKNRTTTSNHKAKNKANKTETKARQKKKNKHKKHKNTYLNLLNPDEQQWATPEKPPKTGKKKNRFFNTFETIPDTPKTNLLILKPHKKQTQKTPFCHVQKQPTIFHKFSVFLSTYSFCFWKAVFAENTIKIVFQENTAFQKHS